MSSDSHFDAGKVLTSDELEWLNSFSKKHFRTPFEIVLNKWLSLPEDLRNGFAFESPDEYFYRANIRSYIELFIVEAPLPISQKVTPFIQSADEEFLKETQPIDNPIMYPDDYENKDKYWYLYRVPKVLNPGLERNLREGEWLK